jgi:hypothetical protein
MCRRHLPCFHLAPRFFPLRLSAAPFSPITQYEVAQASTLSNLCFVIHSSVFHSTDTCQACVSSHMYSRCPSSHINSLLVSTWASQTDPLLPVGSSVSPSACGRTSTHLSLLFHIPHVRQSDWVCLCTCIQLEQFSQSYGYQTPSLQSLLPCMATVVTKSEPLLLPCSSFTLVSMCQQSFPFKAYTILSILCSKLLDIFLSHSHQS